MIPEKIMNWFVGLPGPGDNTRDADHLETQGDPDDHLWITGVARGLLFRIALSSPGYP